MGLAIGHPELAASLKQLDFLNRAQDAVKQNYLRTVFEDFDGDPLGYGNSTRWNPSAGNVNGTPVAGDTAGGVIQFNTSTTASSQVGLAPANAFCGATFNPTTQVVGKGFYCEARFITVTAVTAQTKLFIGFTDGTNTLAAGVFGARSTTLYTVQHSGNETTSFTDVADKAVDTNFHTMRMWHSGRDNNFNVQLDFDTAAPSNIVTVNPSVAYTKLRIFVKGKNGTDAVNRAIALDYLGFACEA